MHARNSLVVAGQDAQQIFWKRIIQDFATATVPKIFNKKPGQGTGPIHSDDYMTEQSLVF